MRGAVVEDPTPAKPSACLCCVCGLCGVWVELLGSLVRNNSSVESHQSINRLGRCLRRRSFAALCIRCAPFHTMPCLHAQIPISYQFDPRTAAFPTTLPNGTSTAAVVCGIGRRHFFGRLAAATWSSHPP